MPLSCILSTFTLCVLLRSPQGGSVVVHAWEHHRALSPMWTARWEPLISVLSQHALFCAPHETEAGHRAPGVLAVACPSSAAGCLHCPCTTPWAAPPFQSAPSDHDPPGRWCWSSRSTALSKESERELGAHTLVSQWIRWWRQISGYDGYAVDVMISEGAF